MKMSDSIVVHPSDYNVAVRHLSVRRQSESNPSCRACAHRKRDGAVLFVETPIQLVVLVVSVGFQRVVRHDLAEPVPM